MKSETKMLVRDLGIDQYGDHIFEWHGEKFVGDPGDESDYPLIASLDALDDEALLEA
jgi:hypothetical protein